MFDMATHPALLTSETGAARDLAVARRGLEVALERSDGRAGLALTVDRRRHQERLRHLTKLGGRRRRLRQEAYDALTSVRERLHRNVDDRQARADIATAFDTLSALTVCDAADRAQRVSAAIGARFGSARRRAERVNAPKAAHLWIVWRLGHLLIDAAPGAASAQAVEIRCRLRRGEADAGLAQSNAACDVAMLDAIETCALAAETLGDDALAAATFRYGATLAEALLGAPYGRDLALGAMWRQNLALGRLECASAPSSARRSFALAMAVLERLGADNRPVNDAHDDASRAAEWANATTSASIGLGAAASLGDDRRAARKLLASAAQTAEAAARSRPKDVDAQHVLMRAYAAHDAHVAPSAMLSRAIAIGRRLRDDKKLAFSAQVDLAALERRLAARLAAAGESPSADAETPKADSVKSASAKVESAKIESAEASKVAADVG